METSSRLTPAKDGYEAPVEYRKKYQSAVGSLMYTMLGTRPNITYAVSVVSRFSSNPTKTHIGAVKRIFQYLQATVHWQLTYQGALDDLTGYTDSNWAGDQATRRSTTRYVFYTPIIIISAFFGTFFFERARASPPFAKRPIANNSTTTHYNYIDYGAIATS